MDNPDPLSELADIHLPDPIGLWPLAPGWWILLILLIAAGFFLYRKYAANWKLQRSRSFAIGELDKCLNAFRNARSSPDADIELLKLNFVNDVNAVLRRVALKHYPEESAASIGGQAWIAFLRNNGDATLLDDSLASTLTQGRFARHWNVDEDALYGMARHWINSMYLAEIPGYKGSATLSSTSAVSDHA